MTTVIIFKYKTGAYKQMTLLGHADYARKHLFFQEPDVLCAAVSALVITTINSLEELAGEPMEVLADERIGFISCNFQGEMQEKSIFLLDSMLFGLEQIQKKYGDKYISIQIEEV